MRNLLKFRAGRKAAFGFTLIEIVIGLAILVMLSMIAWQILSGWIGTSVIGIWRQHTNKALGLVSTRIRSEVGKTSYPSSVTPEDTVVAFTEDYFITLYGEDPGSGFVDFDGDSWEDYRVVRGGPGKDGALDTAEEILFELYQGSPGKARIPGFTDSDVALKKITFYLKSGDRIVGKGKRAQAVKSLFMRTESGSVISDGYTTDTNIDLGDAVEKQLASDVNCVLMGVPTSSISGDASDLTSAPTVKIKVICVEHQKGKSFLSVTINAGGQTGVKFD